MTSDPVTPRQPAGAVTPESFGIPAAGAAAASAGERTPALVLALDREQRIRSAGTAAEHWLGALPASLSGLALASVLDERWHRLLDPHLAAALAGQQVEADLVLPLSNGARAVHLIAAPEFDSGGSVLGVVAVIEDTTERGAALASALAGEARYRDLFENATDALYTLDLAGRLTDLNREAERLTGYARAELLGTPIMNLVVPEHHDRLQPQLLNKVDGAPSTTYQLDIVRRDGQRRTVEVRTRLLFVDGRPVGIQGSARDITERLALLALLERYRLLAEQTSDIVLFVRPNGRIAEANEAAVAAYGYTRDRLCSLTVFDLREPSLLADVPAQLAAANVGDARFETVHRRADGSTFPVQVAATSAAVGDDRLILSIIRDISQHRAAEQALAASHDELRVVLEDQVQLNAELVATAAARDAALEQATAALAEKDAFLGAVSHDLRTPLTAIRGYTQLLERRASRSRLLRGPDVQALATDIERAATRMARLVDDLLSLSRGAGDPRLLQEVEEIDLVALLRQSLAELQQLDPLHRLELQTAPGELRGRWERSSLERVIANLVGNAQKYSPPETAIAVSLAREASNSVVVCITDQGPGIPGDELEHIFERFYRGSNVRDLVAGTGIGLAAVKQMVGRLGGEVWLESRMGRGTTACVRLPV